jgi:hypothetical protein
MFIYRFFVRNKFIKVDFIYFRYKERDMTKEIKLTVLEYLKYERDERIPELIEMYDGDIQYVIDEVWGPLETVLDGKTDEDLVKMIDGIMDDETYEQQFKEWREWNDDEDDLDTLHCGLVWEIITNK